MTRCHRQPCSVWRAGAAGTWPGPRPARWWAASRRRAGGFERCARARAGGGREPGLPSADPPHPAAQLPLTADALTFAEVSKDPKGLEWLWSPQIVGLYNRLLQRCELNRHTTEAAAGALQNITAGDRRVRGRRAGARAEGTHAWPPAVDTGGARGWEPALQEFVVCWGSNRGQAQARGRTRQRREGRRVMASELGRGDKKEGHLRASRGEAGAPEGTDLGAAGFRAWLRV